MAQIQSNTSLSIADTQALTQTTIAAASNANQRQLQEMVNAGNLANIQANGAINTQITQLTNDNRTLLQTSQGAYNLYTTSLQSMSNVVKADMGGSQKEAALNNVMANLNEGLGVLGEIGNIPGLEVDADVRHPIMSGNQGGMAVANQGQGLHETARGHHDRDRPAQRFLHHGGAGVSSADRGVCP